MLQQRAQITLTDDILNDGVEFFLLQLLPASDDLGAFRSLAEATVEIEDNESTYVCSSNAYVCACSSHVYTLHHQHAFLDSYIQG